MQTIDKRKLRGALGLKGLTMAALARSVGLNPATLYRKINGQSDFYLSEVLDICRALDIPDPAALFLSLAVTQTKQREGEQLCAM